MNQAVSEIASTDGHTSRPNATYAYYVISMLMLAYLLSLLDRVLIGLLVEPIRADLGLSDTQLGLLMGFGFVLFYSVLGVPLGALADRHNRRDIITAGVLLWSLATAASGFAGGFAGLMLARTLVGAGEATLSPCAMSTIGDRFERDRLGLAVGIFTMGGCIGIGVAIAVGSYLVHWSQSLSIAIPLTDIVLTGWRVVFLVVGLIGVPFTLLFAATVKEAPRRNVRRADVKMGEVAKHVRAHPVAFSGLFLGYSAQVTATYVPMLWVAPYFQRTHGLAPQEMAINLGLIFGVMAGIGLILGGMLSDRLSKKGVLESPVRILLFTIPLQIPASYIAFTSQSASVAFIALGAQLFFGTFYGALQGVTVQLMSPSTMHGRMMAIYLLFITLIGMGLGPLAVGALSEHVFTGHNALGYSLATTMVLALICAGIILLLCRKKMAICIDNLITAQSKA